MSGSLLLPCADNCTDQVEVALGVQGAATQAVTERIWWLVSDQLAFWTAGVRIARTDFVEHRNVVA